MSKSLICVLAIDGLAIHRPDAMRTFFGEHFRISIKLHAHHLVDAAGSVVPVHFIGGDVVGADLAQETARRQWMTTGRTLPPA